MQKCYKNEALDKAKFDRYADAKVATKKDKEYALLDVKGVQTATTARPKGVSDVGAMIRNPMRNQYGEMKINAAKERIKNTTKEAKKPNLPKSEEAERSAVNVAHKDAPLHQEIKKVPKKDRSAMLAHLRKLKEKKA